MLSTSADRDTHTRTLCDYVRMCACHLRLSSHFRTPEEGSEKEEEEVEIIFSLSSHRCVRTSFFLSIRTDLSSHISSRRVCVNESVRGGGECETFHVCREKREASLVGEERRRSDVLIR